MSVVRSYNLSNGLAVADAPASIVRVLTVVSAQAGSGSGAVDSVNGHTGVVVLGASDVSAQPVDSDLTAIAALTTTTFGRGLLALADAAALRTSAGLGTAATQATSAFDAAGAAASAQAASQPLDSDLTAIAALTTTTFGRSLLTQADAAAARSTLGAGTSSFDGAYSSLTGKPTLGTAAAAATGDFDAAGAAASAQAASQPLDSDLTAIAALATTSFGRSLLTAADAAAARVLTGAGTSSLVIGTSSSTAKAGDYQPTAANISDSTTIGRTILTAANAAAVLSAISAAAATHTHAESDVTNLTTDLAAKQPLDSDLTAIAGLTATTDNFLQSKSSAWASRTPAQVAADLALPVAAQAHTVNTQTGTSYTLVLTDAGKFVTMSNASASTLTVPPNSSVAFPVGTMLDGAQLGAGQVTLTAGAGVTINATPGLKVAAQYGTFGLLKTATDVWLAYGRLSA